MFLANKECSSFEFYFTNSQAMKIVFKLVGLGVFDDMSVFLFNFHCNYE